MIAAGIILPVGLSVYWRVKHRDEKFSTIAIGAAVWFIFAIVLETVPKIFLLTPTTAIGEKIASEPILMTTVAALLAGIFEETGRLIALRPY